MSLRTDGKDTIVWCMCVYVCVICHVWCWVTQDVVTGPEVTWPWVVALCVSTGPPRTWWTSRHSRHWWPLSSSWQHRMTISVTKTPSVSSTSTRSTSDASRSVTSSCSTRRRNGKRHRHHDANASAAAAARKAATAAVTSLVDSLLTAAQTWLLSTPELVVNKIFHFVKLVVHLESRWSTY